MKLFPEPAVKPLFVWVLSSSLALALVLDACSGRPTTNGSFTPALAFKDHARRTRVCAFSNDTGSEVAYTALTPIPGQTACGGASGAGGGGDGGSGAPADSPGDPTGTDPLTPYIIATLPATAGAICGSPVQSLPLGSNLPLGTTGPSTNVVQVWYLYEPNSINPNPAANPLATLQSGQTIVGFIYVTAGNPDTSQQGQYFVQSTGADPNFVLNLMSNLPLLAPLLNAINGTTAGAFSQPLTGPQANSIFKKYPPKGKSSGSGPCFATPLPRAQWA